MEDQSREGWSEGRKGDIEESRETVVMWPSATPCLEEENPAQVISLSNYFLLLGFSSYVFFVLLVSVFLFCFFLLDSSPSP